LRGIAAATEVERALGERVLERLDIGAKLRVQLHRKLSFPLVSAVMVLVGIPFAFVVGRRGALYGIGLSIVIAIVYWTVLSVFEALGNNAMLPPLLGRLGPQPALRRRGPLPDAHAGNLSTSPGRRGQDSAHRCPDRRTVQR
jgi:lipopolysaccharide export LptBFGC system permease protein LptF